jgi:uncharacterized protein
MMEVLPLTLAIFAVALLYASVGHGGASGYLAVMALFAVSSELLRPTALMLNVMVSTIGAIAFYKAGHFRNMLFWPLALGAIPFAYLGGSIVLPESAFRLLLGGALIVAMARLFLPASGDTKIREPKMPVLILSGAGMGMASGLIGVGGGIFLTPLVIILRWAPAKTAAAISAPFIWVNSIAALIGMRPSSATFHPALPWMAIAVLIAGFLGSLWGSKQANSQQLRNALGLVLLLACGKLMFT